MNKKLQEKICFKACSNISAIHTAMAMIIDDEKLLQSLNSHLQDFKRLLIDMKNHFENDQV